MCKYKPLLTRAGTFHMAALPNGKNFIFVDQNNRKCGQCFYPCQAASNSASVTQKLRDFLCRIQTLNKVVKIG